MYLGLKNNKLFFASVIKRYCQIGITHYCSYYHTIVIRTNNFWAIVYLCWLVFISWPKYLDCTDFKISVEPAVTKNYIASVTNKLSYPGAIVHFAASKEKLCHKV